ncbi:MAG: DUF378 domain-containing protein [Nanobdellota archaeon]
MNSMDYITMILVIIGGLNWGLVGVFNFDLVQAVLGSVPVVANIVYTLVGISAVYMIYYLAREE